MLCSLLGVWQCETEVLLVTVECLVAGALVVLCYDASPVGEAHWPSFAVRDEPFAFCGEGWWKLSGRQLFS